MMPIVGSASADNDKNTAEWVAGFIKSGRLVNLVPWEKYVKESRVSNHR